MKRFLLCILALMLGQAVFASLNDVFILDITYDWINKSEVITIFSICKMIFYYS